MSEESFTLLAQLAAGFEERGFEAVLPLADEAFEFHEPPEQPGATVFRGHAAAREGFTRWSETWVEQRSEIKGAQELPDGRIFALTLERMRGRDGLQVENECGHVFTFRGGKILRWQVFWDPANARRAAGLTADADVNRSI